MAISCNNQIFSLHTKHSTYQMKVDRDFLIHTYYGPYVGIRICLTWPDVLTGDFPEIPMELRIRDIRWIRSFWNILLTGPEISEMTVCGWLMQTAVR